MKRLSLRAGALLAAGAALLAACQGTAPIRPTMPLPAAPAAAPPPPSNVLAIPDAVPRVEPRSPYGNPPFYEVFGKRYYVLRSSAGYDERGVASWYGPGFYEERTSTHEPYDMYAMTAAHKTLPLPCYVRVTNLENGRSVVVRVNDRGPFVANRIIDLSYTAAAKLDMLRKGTAMVEVRALDPTLPAPPPMTAAMPVTPAALGAAAVPGAPAVSAVSPSPAAVTTLFIQAGAFAVHANAERLVKKLRDHGYSNAFVRGDEVAGREMYRVRIGPVGSVEDFDRIVGALARIGLTDAHLAMN